MASTPKRISVIVLTFNHEKYIAECLDSIFSQTITSPVDIIVADDCSTDATVSKVKQYQSRYPNSITLLESISNSGHTRNYFRAWEKADGDYVAHCDGDDFWNSPEKLAEQLEFLEANPSFSGCSHKVRVLCDSKYLDTCMPNADISVVNTIDLFSACFPHNSSVFFRNRLFNTFPDFFFSLTGHDWFISVMNSTKGPIKILEKPMSTWRVRSDGLWGGKTDEFHLEHNRFFLEQMKLYLQPHFHRSISRNQAINFLQLAEIYLRQGNRDRAKLYLKQIVKVNDWSAISPRSFWSLFARLQFPTQYELIRNLRNVLNGAPPA